MEHEYLGIRCVIPLTAVGVKCMKYEFREPDEKTVCRLIELSKRWECESCSYGIVANSEDDIAAPLWVAVDNDEIIGYIFGHYYDAKNKTGYIGVGVKCFSVDELYVIPEYRSRGVGKELFRLMEKEVKSSCDYITLTTSTRDYKKILHFYVDELDMDFHNAFLIKSVE